MIKTHVDQFKLRESSKKKDKRTKKERQEQRIIDLLTVKGSISRVDFRSIIRTNR